MSPETLKIWLKKRNSNGVIDDSAKSDKSFVDIYNNCLELKAELLQAKDTTITNLKKQIHSLNAKCNQATIKKDIDEYETINIELEHNVAKLLRENEQLHIEREHLKKTYKELYDSIKKTRVQTKDQCDSLIAQLNQKSVENANLNAQIQEKTIKHSGEHADILKEIVENARALSPLDSNLDSACKYVQRLQEVLVYVKDTCPCLTKPSEKLVADTPFNKNKKTRKGLKRQKEAKTIKSRQEMGKRQRVKSKTKNPARDHSRINPTQSKIEIKKVKESNYK
ncbi:hypothetical protein Tco_0978859 [Tanacetum coccineum]|uniref:Uncharacterized protein n=1 Tax=Tanacetum coccineum TaxID=301880 RepID=A0ABQ5EPL0_9ASTR